MKNDNYNKKSNNFFNYNNKHSDLQNYELSEKDFYPPQDTRVFKSGVKDIVDGDSFDDYLDCFLEMCYEEEIFEK